MASLLDSCYASVGISFEEVPAMFSQEEATLAKSPMGDEQNRDYSTLLNAYRSMRPADFERFIDRFTAAGRDLNAQSNDGQTLLALIADHRHSAEFREILVRHGAAG